MEQAVASVLLEERPDWQFERAIDTDLEGPGGEPYVRLDRLSYHALGLVDEDTGRRGPPTHARVPTKIRDRIRDKVRETPEEWAPMQDDDDDTS